MNRCKVLINISLFLFFVAGTFLGFHGIVLAFFTTIIKVEKGFQTYYRVSVAAL